MSELRRGETSILLEVRENLPQVLTTAGKFNVLDIETHNVSLEEIFLAYYGKGTGGKDV